MDLLPGEHERRALLDGLAALIEARGFETFVAAPLLEPDPRFFPDRWEPNARGVRALALRLLLHAGCHDKDAAVTLYGEPNTTEFHQGAVAWFAGIQDQTCIFGVHRHQLREHDAIVGTLCHEVAHAFRTAYGLIEGNGNDRLEEENTDLTTVYLGFGILTTNNAFRYRKGGLHGSAYEGTRVSASYTGYLSPQAMAFALAAQVTARGLPSSESKRIGRLLETNQQAFFHAARKELKRDADGLRIRLGLPPREIWPEPYALPLDALPEDTQFEPDEPAEAPAPQPPNEGGNVFRVRTRKTGRYALTAFGLVSIGGTVANVLPPSILFAGAVLGAFAFGWLGRSRFTDECSYPACTARLPVDATACPRCGGRIRGIIRDPTERLAAEEALDPTTDDTRRLTQRHRALLSLCGYGSAIPTRTARARSIHASCAGAQPPATVLS